MKITESQLRKIIRKELISEMSDPSGPIHIDDLIWVDDGDERMMLPGPGYSYSVRKEDFEEAKRKIKDRYGDGVMISVPDHRYPKSRKLHSEKFAQAQSRENQNFSRHQAMMKKKLGREPGLGT